MAIKVIAFDFLGVLYGKGHINHEVTMPYLGLAKKDYPGLSDLYIKYKIGKITKEKFWSSLGQKSTIEGKFLRKVKNKFNKDFLKIVKKLDSKYQIVGITDLPLSWAIFLANINNDFTFDYLVVSAWTGRKKVESFVDFKSMLNKMNIKGKEMIFIDDKLANLAKAGKLGIRTVWLKQEEQKSRYQPDYTINKLITVLKIIK